MIQLYSVSYTHLYNTAHRDIVRAIQEKCFGKTKDNYSMYLLQISLAEKTVAQKTQRKNGVLWLTLLAILIIGAGGLFFLNKKTIPAEAMPAPAIKKDSVVTAPAGTIKKDTTLQPGKNAVTDSELLKEEADEKKIIPAPLPEAKAVNDSAAHKKDSLTKHGKPLN